MPGDLSVNPASPSPRDPAVAEPSGPVNSAAGGKFSQPADAATSTPTFHANPVSQLDPALGIVVLHFFNAAGAQTSSIPTQKQLDQYRLHGDAGSGTDTVNAPGGADAL